MINLLIPIHILGFSVTVLVQSEHKQTSLSFTLNENHWHSYEWQRVGDQADFTCYSPILVVRAIGQ